MFGLFESSCILRTRDDARSRFYSSKPFLQDNLQQEWKKSYNASRTSTRCRVGQERVFLPIFHFVFWYFGKWTIGCPNQPRHYAEITIKSQYHSENLELILKILMSFWNSRFLSENLELILKILISFWKSQFCSPKIWNCSKNLDFSLKTLISF